MKTKLIYMNEEAIEVICFENDSECNLYVSNLKTQMYKIYKNEEKNLFFLNAFVWDKIKKDFFVFIPHAKEIKKNILRDIRSRLFSKLDMAFMKALEQENYQKKNYIIELKNKLRDITLIDLPDNEQELIDFIPDVFKEIIDLSI